MAGRLQKVWVGLQRLGGELESKQMARGGAVHECVWAGGDGVLEG